MKIAMLQTPMFPLNLSQCAGVERVELSELEYLHKLEHDIKLFVPRLIGENQNIIEIRDLGWQKRLLKFYYYLNFGYQARNYDLFHGHYTPILALLYPDKSLIHYHGQAVFELPKYKLFKKRYHKAHYVFNSKTTRKAFVEAYPAVPQEHLHLLYNAVDANMFQPINNKSKKKPINICFCGRWTEEKGVFVLLEAVRILEQKRKDFRLHLVGSAHIPVQTEKSQQIEKKVNQIVNGLATVEIIGPLKHEELPKLYQQMDLGIVPSVWEEPFGLVTLEMMASGLPVIASKVGAIPEIIEDNLNGLLVKQNNPELLSQKIEMLLDDAALRIRLADAGRKHVEENFTWEKHLERLLKIYEQIIKT